MKIESKEKYLKVVESKLADARERLAALELDRSPSGTESQHDAIRENVEREMTAQEGVIRGLEQFKEFLVSSGEKSSIEEGAEFSVLLDNNERIKNALYAPISVSLEGVTIITPKSPFGAALLDKKIGESFSYRVGETLILGKVKEIS